VNHEQMTLEPAKRFSADVVNAVDTIRLCERTLPLLYHAETGQREKELILFSLRKLYLTLKQMFEKGAGNNA